MIQKRRPRLFLLVCLLKVSLAFSLVVPAISTRAYADPPLQTTVPPEPPPQSLPAPTEYELRALHLAFRGFVAVTLPGGIHDGCEGHEASAFKRRHQEFYLSWFTIQIEAICIGRAPQKAEVWFQCSDRGIMTCSLSQPYEAPEPNQ